jgi:hypothetical protein
MKKIIVAASVIALLTAAQTSFAQAAQEGKAAKKEQKAEKKEAKAKELRSNTVTGKGIEVAGISYPKTRNAKADLVITPFKLFLRKLTYYYHE